MSKTKLWITIVLAVIALSLIGWNMADFDDDATAPVVNDKDPTYQSQHTVTVVYNPTGKLNYKLVSEDVKYYTTDELSWFTAPVMTLFDDNAVAIWSVRSDRAKLTKDRMLYLYGHVEVDSLTTTSQLEKIKTDNAQVNLVTQDVMSDDEVTLYGTNFTSNGMKMRGNLRAKTAELIDKVKTNYEIQNPKTNP
ncbi:lipopolysaccharide export system protein LptC [Gibbsiella quercinecans]|uniref:Lipopolysaccharide export system protein LptC n=1 Tax=Gibbsiella quercinecans TaxID=929813 RepID=A0A250B2N3_9GAMM|nr:LPS export ABC transporter periplasmic protein LptC [Gibbsiella quercinecans]ATA20498.1 LPS export ABC transporter periplasmic protein LptC [Gibbsiella quercinecans]RLM07507.1 LPS export ABC transporter periplasmic protein LptC [Gibbsiella quercinecans]RLM10783.1 LPS export ABC transporter periplasmic protein LptC [Gibbsiella quercinecans]RLM11198.1 LPS export ABC transporter periplasmic protein LptC [Gibbsiella quercinecans]TCT89361.1 lipopolysaccharide export system protein LptC [Gibbsiel